MKRYGYETPSKTEMINKELKNWLEEYRINLLSLMGEDDYTTGKLDVIRQVLDKLNQNKDDYLQL